MGGPGTSGVLLMAKSLDLLGTGPPSTCGGGTVNFVNDHENKGQANDTVYFEEIERREDAGTPGNIQKIRTGLTFWVKELIGTDLISRETVQIDMALSRLSSNPNVRIYGGTTVKRIAVLSFNVETSRSHGEEPYSGLYGDNRTLNGVEGKYSPSRLFVKGGRRRANYINYMQVAACTTESLPDQSPVRDIPQDVDPHLLTFKV